MANKKAMKRSYDQEISKEMDLAIQAEAEELSGLDEFINLEIIAQMDEFCQN